MVFSRLLRLNSIFTYKPKLTQPLLSLLAIDLRPLCSLSFSTSSLPQTDSPPPDPTTTLSSRMAFVFDQIDAIHRQRNADVDEKDEALQRIRAWRHSKQQKREEGGGGRQVENEVEMKLEEEGVGSVIKKEVEMVHPWPEWIEFMERLLQQNYLDHRRLDEDRMIENVPGLDLEGLSGVGGGDGDFEEKVGLEFWRDWAAVCTACKNFGHDRFDILKSLSRKDIQVLVGYGCPSLDGKVVYSAKLLRKHSHVNEGDVCSACTLRTSCKKGFLLVPKEDEARTLDLMRILLTFGFDSINGSVKNRPLMKMKSVKTVVRKLLYEIVKLSAVPIDPNLPRPIIKKLTPKVKQAPPPPKKRVGRDDVEMKKGDWLCGKCDFMNFAKNTVCLQCDAKRPKRQLLPGEWECPECNFLNYRRNMACFHCECKRPQDEYTENQEHAKQHEPRNRPIGSVRMSNVSDAWNFDFDENESDGADVAAFEFADPPRRSGGDSEKYSHEEVYREYSDERGDHGKGLKNHKRDGYFSNSDERNINSHASRTGFDDFDDEEDDVDSYEIDMADTNKDPVISRKRFSELENASESEEFDDYNHSKNDDVSLSKSKVFDSVPKIKTRRDKYVSYGSDDDDDIDLHSDSDDRYGKHFPTSMRRGRGFPEQKNTVRQSQRSDRMTSWNSIEKNDAWDSRGGQRNNRGAIRNDFSSNMEHNRRRDRVNYDRSGRASDFDHNYHQSDRGRKVNQFGGRKRNDRRDDSCASSRPFGRDRVGSSRNRSSEFDNKSRSEERPRRRIIER